MGDESTFQQLSIDCPFVMEKCLNSVKLGWNPPKNSNDHQNYRIVYILQMRELVGSWKRIHWGLNTTYQVTNLLPGPDNIYGFRLKAYLEGNNDKSSEWSSILYTTAKHHPLTLKHLHRAVNANKNHEVKEIAKAQPNLINTENTTGQTALDLAIENNNSEMVAFLLNVGSDVDNPALTTLRTPLMVAIINSHLNIAKILIEKGANVNCQDINGCTPLHHAVDTNRIENVEFMLKFNPDRNLVDRGKWTSLLRAVVMDANIEIIELLVNQKYDINAKDIYKLTCLDHAILNNRNDLVELFKKMANEE